MKHVLVFGTFDKIHKGHEYFLKQSKRYGDYLTVVVTRDKNVKKQKGRYPINSENTRLNDVRKLKKIDSVFLGERSIRYRIIKKIKPDVICIGYDQKPSVSQCKKILKDLHMENVAVKRIKSYKPEIYKSSLVSSIS